jgi:hypothetical protein
MISSEVQRTLVKSPPELWAELSDPTSLARHLGELGEIKITRVEPEKTVEWEAADTTGKVLLKPSGWGTKVTLTAARELAAPEPPAAVEIEIEVQSEPVVEVAPEPEPAIEVEPAIEAEPEPAAEDEPEPEVIIEEPAPRLGFFARLFRRRAKEQATLEPEVEPELAVVEPELAVVEPELAVVEPELAVVEPEQPPVEEAPQPDAPAEVIPDLAAELKMAEETAAEEVTAVLTAALDRLGAAHHRPFSRS